MITTIQSFKGTAFVLVTALIIYFLLLRELHKMRETERTLKVREQEYREIFNVTEEAIFIHNGETGEILDVNPATLAMHDCTYEEALSLTTGEMSANRPPYSQNEAVEHIRKAFKEGPQRFEWISRKVNGPEFWTEVSLKGYTVDGTCRVIAVIRDISERKQAEQKRIEIETQVRQSQKMEAIGSLAGGVAHDFNNILTAVIGYAELAHEDLPIGHELRHNMEEILKAGNRAKDIVKQILMFSRQSLQTTIPMEIHLIVKEALSLIRVSIPTNIAIQSDINANTGFVKADPTQLHQVIMNLCTNAYHAMRESGGTLRVSLERVQIVAGEEILGLSEGAHARIVISDTGCGMNTQTKERIFDPYFTTKAVGEGTGMGLPVVHGIVNGLNGKIAVESKEGEGTTFEIFLPLMHSPPKKTVEEECSPLRHGSGRVLFVDDEDPVVNLGKHLLSRLGYAVEAFNNSPEALSRFLKAPEAFDLVITDMSMPVLTGSDLTKKILQLRPDIPIIICTGFSDSIDEEKAFELGVKAFLLKPYSNDELANTIAEVIEK